MTERQADKQTGYPSIDKPWLKYYDDEAKRYSIPEKTAYQYMINSNKDHLNDTAIEYYGRHISYKQLMHSIDVISVALLNAGIQKGDIITICSITVPEVIYIFYAANKIGAVVNMIDPRINKERFAEILHTTGSKLLFCLDLIYEKINSFIKDYMSIGKCVILSATTSLPAPLRILSITKRKRYKKCDSFKKFLKNNSKGDTASVRYEPNMPAAIVYTGGTTGVPKGAMISNEGFNAIAEDNRYCFPPKNKRGQKLLDIMPPFIAYGLVAGIHMPISLGAIVVIVPKFQVSDFPKLIKKYKPQHTLGVPSHYSALLDNPEMDGVDLSFLIDPAAGGDSMNSILEVRLNDFLLKHNCKSKIVKGYGMTELSSEAIISSMDFNKLESVGIPFANNNVGAFVPGTDDELKYGEIGEICISSPSMFLGYINKDENQTVIKTHSDGTIWIHSQDYGYIDKDGFVYIKGRIKRTIVRPDGHNNYPMEMENVLNTYPTIMDSAVVGFEAEKYGNGYLSVAFVVLEKGNEIDFGFDSVTSIISYCKEKLPQRDIPCGIINIKKLPVTNIGKIDYKQLEEQLNVEIKQNVEMTEHFYELYEDTLVIR